MKLARTLCELNLLLLIWFAFTPRADAEPTNTQFVLDRDGSTLVLEPYSSGVIRVTLSTLKDKAMAAPGYGFIATPNSQGWIHRVTQSADVYSSSQLTVEVAINRPETPTANNLQLSKYFDISAPRADIVVKTHNGKVLLEMEGWSMTVPNEADGNLGLLHDERETDEPFYQVGADFAAPPDEHYYGLGQHQDGYLDYRGHPVQCWHDYWAPGGESVCVPFLVSNYGYGIVWDNPSKTTIAPGINDETKWVSQVGDRVSYFVIAGNTADEIYSRYRDLTGSTPMLPKAAYGFIQSKNRYDSQQEVLAVAKGYRDRRLPADMLVIDFLYYTKMGQMDFDPAKWPNPKRMNDELHAMGFETMISVWPRFAPGSRYFDYLLTKGWFEHHADGTPNDGYPYDRAGSVIDTTDPEAARWYWNTIRRDVIDKGFDSLWLDETEPDLPPNGSYFSIGPGTRYFNVYPLFHTSSVYDGFRRDLNSRALIFSRAAYIGSQKNGTVVWSSDISPTWDELKRQIPAGLNSAASGMTYWCNDIGGFLILPAVHHAERPLLIDPSEARSNIGGYEDYPELFVRWFEYGTFEPIFRTHGHRINNEVWSYGSQAEAILTKFLRLRYQLIPYIYSASFQSYKTGAPIMRALFMDFPEDPRVSNIGDEYMFGTAFLVAPVTEQGVTKRSVYLPAGSDWYNYWTNEKSRGGHTIMVDAPIDKIPLFVRAGSILPIGSQINSTAENQRITEIRVYSGADGRIELYQDDGHTYAYEKGVNQITRLTWDNRTGVLSSNDHPTSTGALRNGQLTIIGR